MTWRTASSARSFRIEGWIFILIRAERETLKHSPWYCFLILIDHLIL